MCMALHACMQECIGNSILWKTLHWVNEIYIIHMFLLSFLIIDNDRSQKQFTAAQHDSNIYNNVETVVIKLDRCNSASDKYIRGHCCVLQSPVSELSPGHASPAPSVVGLLQRRWRVWCPVRHDTEQSLHAAHSPHWPLRSVCDTTRSYQASRRMMLSLLWLFVFRELHCHS